MFGSLPMSKTSLNVIKILLALVMLDHIIKMTPENVMFYISMGQI